VPLAFFYSFGLLQFTVERVAFNSIRRFRIQGSTPPPTLEA